MRRLVCILAIALPGCAADATRPETDLSGRWTFVGHFSNAEVVVSCKGAGTVEIHQTGATFLGGLVQTRTCSGRDQAGERETAVQPITEGEVDGASVRFQVETCSYTGTLGGPDVMTGHTTCALTILGERYQFEGQWHAGR